MITRIRIKDFRCFKGEVTLDIPNEPGLYLVRGENLDSPDLQGNAVGKSTLWDALHWCLYGATTRGVRAGGVQCWGGDDQAEVEVDWGGHSIQRTQGPNSLLLDGSPCQQSEIDEIIGLDQAGFGHCIMFGQFAPYFFDLSPTDKLQLLTELLDLDVWQKCQDRAKARVQALEQLLRKQEMILERNKGQVAAFEQTMKSLMTSAAGWEADRKQRAAQIKKGLLELRDDYASVERSIIDLPHSTTDEQVSLAVVLKSDESVLKATERLVARQTVLLEEQQKRLAGLDKNVVMGRCHVCKQEVSNETRQALVDTCKKEIESLKRSLDAYIQQLEDQEARTRVSRERLVNEQDAYRRRQQQEGTLRQELQQIERDAERQNAELAKVKIEQNAYITQIEDMGAKIASLQEEVAKLIIASETDAQAMELAKYWVTGFKELRLWVIDQSLAELEIAVNSSLLQLGLVGWSVAFAVERETKARTVARGFNVEVRSPGTDEPAAWNSWSGGELQRLRVAGAIGFGNLIRGRRQAVVNMEVWDEPTAHLSDQGVYDLLQWLEDRAVAEGKIIWLLDHRSLEYSGFKGTLTVYKQDGASRLEWA